MSTLSTNLGGQEVTTSVCKVYLRDGATIGLNPSAREQLESVDPRSYDCSVAQVRGVSNLGASIDIGCLPD